MSKYFSLGLTVFFKYNDGYRMVNDKKWENIHMSNIKNQKNFEQSEFLKVKKLQHNSLI